MTAQLKYSTDRAFRYEPLRKAGMHLSRKKAAKQLGWPKRSAGGESFDTAIGCTRSLPAWDAPDQPPAQ
jgi:hypothetical protein